MIIGRILELVIKVHFLPEFQTVTLNERDQVNLMENRKLDLIGKKREFGERKRK